MYSVKQSNDLTLVGAWVPWRKKNHILLDRAYRVYIHYTCSTLKKTFYWTLAKKI